MKQTMLLSIVLLLSLSGCVHRSTRTNTGSSIRYSDMPMDDIMEVEVALKGDDDNDPDHVIRGFFNVEDEFVALNEDDTAPAADDVTMNYERVALDDASTDNADVTVPENPAYSA
jgi:hypothetical protein